MGTRRVYRERRYAFGQQLLSLRTRAALTQMQLAEQLGVHRRTVQNWEIGEFYPKAETLQRLIGIFLHHQAFTEGHERAEAEALWSQAAQDSPHPLASFDDNWFLRTLDYLGQQPRQGSPHEPGAKPTTPRTIVDWGATRATPLEQTVRTSAAWPAQSSQPQQSDPRLLRRLPYQPTAVIGRDQELTEIVGLFGNPACRLLTLLGPGGIGKTRLALELATRLTAAFADGIAWVELASIGTAEQIVSAIGHSLDLTFADQPDPTAHLVNALRQQHILLVLDNFEHVLDGAELVVAILAHAPHVRILVTSRERLDLQAEWLFDVQGLTYPPEEAYGLASTQRALEYNQYSAVQLFMQRAAQVQPRVSFSEAALATVVRICQQLAGIPLAIELAVTGLRTMSLAEIELHIRTNLDVLATTLRDVPARHRSMRAVFDHSWSLLNESQQALFSHVAVFRGGWTLEGAVQVARATPTGLAALGDKSLVRQELWSSIGRNRAHDESEARFTMLEPIREYALERLAARPDVEDVRRRHAHYCTTLAETALAQWNTPLINQAIALQRREHDNMRAALQWAYDTGDALVGLQLALALWGFWRSYGYSSEGRAWLERLLRLDAQPIDRIGMAARQRGLHAAAWLASDQHDFVAAARFFEQSMTLRRALGETKGETDQLINEARQARALGQYQRATALLEDALAWQRASNDGMTPISGRSELSLHELGQVLRELALVLRERGEFVRAVALLDECVALYGTIDDRVSLALAWLGLSDIARDQGDSARIRRYCEPSLAIFRESDMHWAIGFALNNLAVAAQVEGDLLCALAHARESVALFRRLQAEGGLAEVLITLGQILHMQGEMLAARKALSEALRLAQARGPRLMVVAATEGLASVLVAQGHVEHGARLLASASGLRAQLHTPVRSIDQASAEQALATARSILGDVTFAAIWAEAQGLSVEQIVRTILL